MYDTCFRKDGRFILAAGNNMTKDTPYESLKALLDEGINYGIFKDFLLVANQSSNNITIFSLQDGKLTDTRTSIYCPKPVCIT